MDDYISREEALMVVCGDCTSGVPCKIPCPEYERMKSLQAANVRPVVLCRDCEHSIDGFVCKKWQWNGMTFPGNFCSDGEYSADMRGETDNE